MRSVIILLTTIAFDRLVQAVLIGALLDVLRYRFSLRFSKVRDLLILLAIFAFLDLYWLPALTILDARIRVLNPEITNVMGLSKETPLIELVGFGWLDLFIWWMQIIVAVWVADKLAEQRPERVPNTSLQPDR
jgi:hypothetical protein